MRKLFTALFFTTSLFFQANAQKTIPQSDKLTRINATVTELTAPFAGRANLDAHSPFFAKAYAIKHGGPDDNITNDEINSYLQANKYIFIDDAKRKKISNEDIKVVSGYKSNPYNGGTPMDNSIAVSNNGIIVSAVNTNFYVHDTLGNLLEDQVFNNSFFGDPSLTGTIFDPRVTYDSESDRFIMCIMHGNMPSNSKLIVMFSVTNNPVDGWNIYILSGNPISNGTWFDYPHIAVSNDEVFITGNLFVRIDDDNNNFNQSVIYQINKKDGYNNAGNLDYQVWSSIQNADGGTAFSLVPVGYGFQGTQGPGMYFLATRSSFNGDKIDIFYINNTKVSVEEEISSMAINVTTFIRPNWARQKDIMSQLSTGDCRMQSAFMLDSTIHFVFGERGSGSRASIRYGKLNIVDLSYFEKTFGSSTEYYAFPSITAFTNVESEQAALICFEATSSDKYPEVRIVAIGKEGTFTESFLVKEGEKSVNIGGSSQQRWGDYTGIARKHNAQQPEVWVCAAYGWGVGIWANHNAKIITSSDSTIVEPPKKPVSSEPKVYPNPTFNNPITTIGLEIPEDGVYTVKLFDASGQYVRTVLSDYFTTDHNRLVFNNTEFASGRYIITIESDKGYYKQLKIIILNDN